MSLTLRASRAEGVLRSVGNPPNGVVGWSLSMNVEEDSTWFVDGKWDPKTDPRYRTDYSRDSEGFSAIALDELVAGLADEDAAKFALTIAEQTAMKCLQAAVGVAAYDVARQVIDDLEVVLNALQGRFAE